MNKQAIGARLRKLRVDAGLPQWAVAKVLFTTQAMISAWECGTTTIMVDMVMRYSRHFNVSTDWILFGEEDE